MWVCGGGWAASQTWKATNKGSRGFDEFFCLSSSLGHFSVPKTPMIGTGGIHGQLKLSERLMLESRPGKMEVATPLALWFREGSAAGSPVSVRGGGETAVRETARPFSGVGEPWFISASHWSTGGMNSKIFPAMEVGKFLETTYLKGGDKCLYHLSTRIHDTNSFQSCL